MATLAEIEKAIRVADKAGRKADVRALEAEYRRLKGGDTQQPAAAQSIVPGGEEAAFPPYMLPGPPTAKQEYDALPEWQKPVQATQDIIRILSNGLTFGGTDKFAEYLGGSPPDVRRAETARAMERAGLAGNTAEALGMSMLPMGKLAQAEKLGLEGAGWFKKLLGGSSVAAAEGGIGGGLYAAGHDQDVEEGMQTGMALGPLARYAIGAGGKAVDSVANLFNPAKKALSKQDIPVVMRSATGRAMTPTPGGGTTFIDEGKAADFGARQERFNKWSETVTDAERASSKPKGPSYDKAIRDKSEVLIKQNRRNGRFKEAEVDSLEDIVRGRDGRGRNFLAGMGSLSPSSNMFASGMGGTLGGSLGYWLGGAPMAAAASVGVPAAGWVAKMAADRMAKRATTDFGNEIIAGAKVPTPKNAVQETTEASRDMWEKLLRNWAIAGRGQ